MGLMNYGVGSGLAYVHDFNADITRAQNNEILDNQARINHENQVALLGDQLTAKHLETTWDNQQLKPFVESQTKKIGEFVMQNPDYKMNPVLYSQYKTMLNEIQDNDFVRNSMNANTNYGALVKYIQDNPGSENDPQIQAQLSAYKNYNDTGSSDGVSGNRKAYVFSSPDTFDPTVGIGAVYGKLKTTESYTAGHGFGATETKVTDNTLKATAASILSGPEAFKYQRAWQAMPDGMKSFYNNDPIQWIAEVGRGYTETSVKAGTMKKSGDGSGDGGSGGKSGWSAWQHDMYRAQQTNMPIYLPNVAKVLPISNGTIQLEGDLKIPTANQDGSVGYKVIPGYNGTVAEVARVGNTQVLNGIPYAQVQIKVPMKDGLVLGENAVFKDTSWLGSYHGGDVEEVDAYKPVASFALDKDGKKQYDDNGDPYAMITTYVRVPTDPVAQRNYDVAETGQATTNKAEGVRQTGYDVDTASTVAQAMGLDVSKMQYSASTGTYYAPDAKGVLQAIK